MSDVTFLVQGRLTKEGVDTISKCINLGSVVLSCWDDDDPNLIDKAKNLGAKVVISNIWKNDFYNYQNVRYHIQTTLEGLRHTDTDLVIKLRGDEYYENLLPLKEKLINFPDKWIACNVFFRKDYLFHPSDHVIGMNKKDIKKTYEDSLAFINQESVINMERLDVEFLGLKPSHCFPFVTCENLLCLNYLGTKGFCLESLRGLSDEEVVEKHRDLIIEHFKLVRVSELGRFLCRFNSNPKPNGPKFFTNEKQMIKHGGSKSITAFDQL